MARFLRSILVELQITTTANGSTINFADVPQLRGKFVQGIESYTANEVRYTQTQRPVVPTAAVNCFLVNLLTDSETTFENIPYFTFNTYNNGGIIREFKNLKININKSNIYITNNGGVLATTDSALFTFYYTDMPV